MNYKSFYIIGELTEDIITDGINDQAMDGWKLHSAIVDKEGDLLVFMEREEPSLSLTVKGAEAVKRLSEEAAYILDSCKDSVVKTKGSGQ